MVYFNLISGLASIASLVVSILAFVCIRKVEIRLGGTEMNIKQRAEGRDIKQAGGDMNG